jgi:hypothetical protein
VSPGEPGADAVEVAGDLAARAAGDPATLERYRVDASTPPARHFIFDPEWLERQWGA